MNQCSNIAIIGFMGAGKSTVGRLCASMLGMEFVDIDEVVQRSTGHRIAEVFAECGEGEFRRLEAAALREVASSSGAVIATGGGAILNPDTRATLCARCFCVWLRVSVAESSRRLAGVSADRPLWSSVRAESEARLAAREPLYRLCAHATVSTDGLSAENVALAVVQLWSKGCGDAGSSAKA
ncbi:MAG: shikimate kinase [Armatimonadetes bacterium]|nr:shikimate kinase [Armatimonadota bacterium]MDE2206458.1 shikimate kinase [Armatimonadota bacterium]